MNKKITIAILIAILLATAVVFLMFVLKNNTSSFIDKSVSKNASSKNVANTPDTGTKKEIVEDTDTKAIESIANSISAEDFNVDALSDKSVGL